jgi:hypothetical protein
MICLDPIIDGDEIRNLKCSHCFHSKCVDIWLLGTLSDESLNTSICPTCRQEAISADYVSVASSDESPSSQQSQSTNSQILLSPRPIYLPPAQGQDNPSTNQIISSNSSCSESTESNTGFRPQDSDIPREIFMRVGQYLLDEATMIETPSPLMSPAPLLSPGLLSYASEQAPVTSTQANVEIPIRSRTSSISSVSSSQSIHSSTSSSSSVSSFLSIPNSVHSGSGVYINFSVLGNSFDILSIASGE